MFNASKIKANLYGVVGCRQPLNPNYAILDADNISSNSDQWVTENPYCKIEYLYDSADYSGLSDADFNTYLKQIQEDSIVEVATRVFNKPDYIDRQVLFKNAQNRVSTETLPDGFVCFKICVASTKNIAFEIKRIILNFEGSGDIKIMLFNTSQDDPIQEQIVTISSTNQAVELNWKVDNSGDTYKGEYYLGYLTNYVDIGTLKPFKRDYENSDIMSIVSELSIDRYYFSGHNTETIPDLTTEDGLDQSIGLNPDITVYEDYTDLIIQNKSLLATAIKMTMQIKFIEIYMASLRSNINDRQAQMNITRLTQIIEGSNATESVYRVTGIRPELNKSISYIRKELDRLRHGYFGERAMIDTLE